MTKEVTLTEREAEVLRLRLQGLSHNEIGLKLGITSQRVTQLVAQLRLKGLDVR